MGRGARLVVLLCAGPALAGEPPAPPREALTVDDPAAARLHYDRGRRLYDLGRFHEAAGEFEAAYQAKDSPALLFNVAQAYRQAGDNRGAITAYEAYLRRAPESSDAAQVRQVIDELRALQAQQEKSAREAPRGTRSPDAVLVARPARRALWVGIGVGAVALVVAALAVGLAVGLAAGNQQPTVMAQW